MDIDRTRIEKALKAARVAENRLRRRWTRRLVRRWNCLRVPPKLENGEAVRCDGLDDWTLDRLG